MNSAGAQGNNHQSKRLLNQRGINMKTTTNFHSQYKQQTAVDNRPGSAQVAQQRPMVSIFHFNLLILFHGVDSGTKSEKASILINKIRIISKELKNK